MHQLCLILLSQNIHTFQDVQLLITYRRFCESGWVVVDIIQSDGCCSCVGQTIYCTVHIFDLDRHHVLAFYLKKKCDKMIQEKGK